MLRLEKIYTFSESDWYEFEKSSKYDEYEEWYRDWYEEYMQNWFGDGEYKCKLDEVAVCNMDLYMISIIDEEDVDQETLIGIVTCGTYPTAIDNELHIDVLYIRPAYRTDSFLYETEVVMKLLAKYDKYSISTFISNTSEYHQKFWEHFGEKSRVDDRFDISLVDANSRDGNELLKYFVVNLVSLHNPPRKVVKQYLEAEWIEHKIHRKDKPYQLFANYECSICNKVIEDENRRYKFCPYCGVEIGYMHVRGHYEWEWEKERVQEHEAGRKRYEEE